MTVHITWAVLGHLFLSLLCLFGVVIGYGIWIWQFDERLPLPVRIFGLLLVAASIALAIGIWFL